TAAALTKEKERLDNLWLFTSRRRDAKREGGNTARLRRHVLGLMHLLDATPEADAQNALMELNEIRPSFDWESLIPEVLAVTDRVRMHRLLQVMAGTTQLGEARNALTFVRNILADHNLSWENWEQKAA